MQLCLLGPFELVRDGRPEALPGRGERALLAVLALSAGRTVAATTLIESLWPEERMPEDPVNALQIRVSKLRRALDRAGLPDAVHRHGAGYRLEVDSAHVDAHRFESLVESARVTGDPAHAVEVYDRALALWRGEPLVDFAGEPWAAVEGMRLAELRFAALAERADRTLTLGRYERTVADLEPVVRAAPTRERLAGQLMTALFNTGRQSDALGVYARVRTVLAEELGLDPSRELRTVMEQVLRQDAAITSAAPARVAPVAPPGVPPHNLPLRTTSFVGREGELARCRDLLATSRLITLVGPGGAGKTALAVEAARAAAGSFDAGARIVRLASVAEPGMLPQAFADALGLSIEGGTAARRAEGILLSQLVATEQLIVVDNCEHLLDATAWLVAAILGRCAGVRILATSREALAVPGEVQLPVAPLSSPGPGTRPATVPDFPAARLFLDRAGAVSPGIATDEETLAAVGSICHRLDGIPLALELAAARLGSLSPAELAERVADRFTVLTTGARTAERRQRTLRDTVDWSHDLLAEREQRLFRRLAVFRGGWSLEAAEAVCSSPELPAGEVWDVLDRLVRQSLVTAERGPAATRYRMLETLRQYAADKLDHCGEGSGVAERHAAHFLNLAEQAESGLRGAAQARWVAALTEDHANLRAALRWYSTAPDGADGALRLAGSLGMYWHMGRHLEGREVLRNVMALPGGTPEARARALQAVSLVERPRACIVHPSEQCAAAAQDSLAIFTARGDRRRAAFSRLLLGVEGVAAHPRVDAARLLDDAERDFTDLRDEWGLAVVAFVRMEILFKRGDRASARVAAELARERFRRLGDGWGLSAVLYHYGLGMHRFGAYADAVPLLQEAVDVAAAAGVSNTVQWAAADLGLSLLALGRVEEAAACFERAGVVSDQVGDHAGRTLSTYAEAIVALQHDDPGGARPLFEAARIGFENLGVRLAGGLALAGLAACAERAGDAGGAARAYAELLDLAERTAELGLRAVALEGLARAALPADPAGAAELLGRAAWLRASYELPSSDLERTAAERAAQAARNALSAADHAEATTRGATMEAEAQVSDA